MIKLHASTAAVHWGAATVIGTTLNQRFTLDKELGRGGMGAVYRATDQVLQRTVAIKVLRERTDDQVGRKLRLEAQILARLVHDNVVRLYDFGEADGIYFFVMEEVDGPSFVRRWKQVTLPERLRIIAQTADALDYAHHQGVIHRDVKPANVLLTSIDQAKLSDFGLSLIADETQVSGTVKGTPHYMSPEQAKGSRLDYRTDLYSIGVMMYECATGSPPFTGPTMAVMAGHVNSAPEPPRVRNPSVSPVLEALILRLLEKDPVRRPHSGSEVAALIRDLIAYDPSTFDPAANPSDDATIRVGTTPPLIPVAPSTPNGRPSLAPAPIATFASMTVPETRAPDSIAPPPVTATAPAQAGGSNRERAMGMIADVVADPIALSADDRYFCGHYLAYLLGGSRRRGSFRRRPLDPLNADRARLMLAMTWLMIEGPKDGAIERAAALLESNCDVRAALNPIVVIKYLATRDNPNKKRSFRQARKRLQDASPTAGTRMTDEKGVLNPGLMPQVLDDLSKVSPARVEVDDQLVGRWNRVVEVWRSRPDFRQAVLGYATTSAWREPSSADLWPEVVYPLIERARWQRKLRSGVEAAWDNVCGALHLPDAGNTLDRAIQKVVPANVLAKLDASLDAFEDDPQLDVDMGLGEVETTSRGSGLRVAASSFHDIDPSPSPKSTVRLCSADPVRLTMGDLRDLYQEAVVALRTPGSKAGHRLVAIGPYRLAVIPSIRGKSAGQIAIQGMLNKQIEMLIPSIRLASSIGKPILAAWTYANDSMAVAYVDHKNTERYISWHAPTTQQENFDDPAALNSTLLQLNLESPDQLSLALSKRFRPRNPV